MNKQSIVERLKTLHDYRQELTSEAEMLKKLLSQLQEQVHVLQIEQFHLAGILKTADNPSSQLEEKKDPLTVTELDLSVPAAYIINDSEEEEEQD